MVITVSSIKDGSYHLRFYNKGSIIEHRPPYVSHTILEPIGDGGAELKGLTTIVSKQAYKDVLIKAKELGFTYIKVTRIKNSVEIVKIYE